MDKLKVIVGNILDIESGIICHQVNCQKVAGAGLALQIGNKWPVWYHDFLKSDPYLGKVSVTCVDKWLLVANFYAQEKYGSDGKCYTDYAAFRTCLNWLADATEFHERIYFPYKIGCGLAGGDWQTISQMIEEILPDATIVRLPNG